MIRKAEKKDSLSIAEIYNEYVKQGTSTMESKKTVEAINQWISKYTDREGLYVLEDENQIIKGWGIIKKYSDRYGYRFACETSIYVDLKYRRQKIGHQINKFLIKKAKELNYKHMTVKIFAINTASIDFFSKYGYTIVGKQNKIGFLNNNWIDMVIMEKNLD